MVDKTEEKYYTLTGVDIVEQMKLWNERGKGYYGEFLVFKELFSSRNLPGVCKILMNIQIPVSNGKTTEIDLLLIHETGLYVFEIKHYKGTIYGKVNDQRWTQYFRTESNQTFRNPIAQNQYHIEALCKMYPQVPVYSFIVFTNEDCDLRVECSAVNITVCTLRELWNSLSLQMSQRSRIMNMEQINTFFEDLEIYSPMIQNKVIVSDQEVPFYDYIHQIITVQKQALQRNKEELEQQIKRNKKAAARTKNSVVIVCIIIGLFCMLRIAMVQKSSEEKLIQAQSEVKKAQMEVEKAQAELEEFAHKFEHIEEFNGGDITLSDTLITVTDVVLANSNDVDNTVVFSCVLNWNGEEYGIHLVDNTKYIVILQDGSAQEYDLFGIGFLYTTVERIGKGRYETFQLPVHEFYGIKADDIAYIKLVDINIWKDGVNFGGDLFSGYELELYCK
ncbi:MAG: NERD domain-containing protein [Firmicutes bacterium]|nr:NERD domain-containing protein [Bacillota bacterium]